MASTTTELGLTKPAGGEAYSIDVFNQNFQKIDDAFHLSVYVNTTTPSSSLCPNDYDTSKNPAIAIFKRSGICFISFRGIGRTHVEDEVLISELPQGYRPVTGMYFVITLSGKGSCVGQITATGRVTIWNIVASIGALETRAVFGVSFPCT